MRTCESKKCCRESKDKEDSVFNNWLSKAARRVEDDVGRDGEERSSHRGSHDQSPLH